MSDTFGQADIRSIDIQKLAVGFADEQINFRKYVNENKTKAREIRWYQKTAGFVDSDDTTAITASQIENTDFGSLPVVVRQSVTRNTSYVRKYFVESETIPQEDVMDSDPDLIGITTRDLVRAVMQRVNLRIWDVITESRSVSNINSEAITNEWDDYSNATPIADLTSAKSKIRAYGYNPEGAILFLNDNEHTYLLNWLISTKGASIPQFASNRVVDGKVQEILGLNVVVDTNVTADYALIMIPQIAATWKSFTPLTTAKIYDEGIGYKIRVWEEGECILHDPKACCLLSNVGPS